MSIYGVGSGRLPTTPQSNQGFFGRWASKAWNGIKSGAGKAGNWIKGTWAGKAGKWAWDNKKPIMNTVGGALQGFGMATANPAIAGAGLGLSLAAQGIKEGEAKKALEKVIDEYVPNPYSNSVIGYTDMPRIHYSRKPASMRIYNNPNAEATLLEGGPPLPTRRVRNGGVRRRILRRRILRRRRI